MYKNKFNLRKVVAIATCLAVTAMFSGCKKDNGGGDPDDPNVPGGTSSQTFKIKQATIVYDVVSGLSQETVTFDDNGKRFRLEEQFNIYLLDENAKKAYSLNKSTKKYEDVTVEHVQGKRRTYFMNITEANYAAAGYKKTTETVAGKSCTVYSGTSGSTTVSVGGWNDILFLSTLNGGDVMRVLSFSETVAAGSFDIPSDYTKK